MTGASAVRLSASLPGLLLALLLAGCQTTGKGGPAPAAGGSAGPGRHQAVLLPDSTTIAFRGEITHGAAQALVQLVRANPQVRTVQLESEGGYLQPAMIVANALQLRGATTVVTTHCLSACTLFFLGGKRRYIAEGAQLGFHRAWRDLEEPEEQETLEANLAMRRRLLERGVTPGFADRVLATPGHEMWFPTPAELLAGGVIIGVLAPGQPPKQLP